MKLKDCHVFFCLNNLSDIYTYRSSQWVQYQEKGGRGRASTVNKNMCFFYVTYYLTPLYKFRLFKVRTILKNNNILNLKEHLMPLLGFFNQLLQDK